LIGIVVLGIGAGIYVKKFYMKFDMLLSIDSCLMPHTARELCKPPQGRPYWQASVRNYVVHPVGVNSGPSHPRAVPGEEVLACGSIAREGLSDFVLYYFVDGRQLGFERITHE